LNFKKRKLKLNERKSKQTQQPTPPQGENKEGGLSWLTYFINSVTSALF
jgi:hypothetical protein